MAKTIAKYIFPDKNSADKAHNKLYSEFGSVGHYQWGKEIHLQDNCKDPSLASNICTANGGKPK